MEQLNHKFLGIELNNEEDNPETFSIRTKQQI